jgi:protein phosphatase
MSVILRTAAVSDRGKVRENNEDAVHAGAWLVAVADGVGGGPSGEVASDIAISSLADAVRTANQRIRAAAQADPELAGMGTTLTAMRVTGDHLELVHIGDSRAYRWRDATLTQLSRDDTFVQGLVDQGLISAAQAREHPQRSLVTQAMNGSEIRPSYTTVRPRAGDRYLLCSDGLSDYVDDEAIARALAAGGEPDECARQLVDLALAAGAPDNVSVVVAVPDLA